MTMEPDPMARGVEGMEIAIRQTTSAVDTSDSSAGVATRVTFEDFWRADRASLARALVLTLGDVHLAAEATDEAMARAFQHWPRVSTLDSPMGWTYRVGLNWSRSVLRRVRRRPPLWLVQPNTQHDTVPIDPSITAALRQLPAGQRSVVVCRLLLNQSELQTAHLLHIRPGTVKSRLARATNHLAISLAHLDPRENQS